MAKLTREDVPAFMFLIHEIKKKESFQTSNNRFSHVAQVASDGEDFRVTEKTVRRVFNLEANLTAGKIIEKDYTKPTMKTLNVLTTFCFLKNTFDRQKTTFNAIRHKGKEVTEHYLKHKPDDEILDLIFAEPPQKIKHLQDYEEQLIAIAEELKNSTLEDFIENWYINKMGQNPDYHKLKRNLVDFIEERIFQIEKKQKRASFLYRIFGSLGLIFITTPQYDDLKTYIAEVFIEESDDFDMDDFDDDDDED